METSNTSRIARIFSGLCRVLFPAQVPIAAGLVAAPGRPSGPEVVSLASLPPARYWPPEGPHATAADRARVDAQQALFADLENVISVDLMKRVCDHVGAITRLEEQFVLAIIRDHDETLADHLQPCAFVEAFTG